MRMRVEEDTDGKFEVCIGNEWVPDATLDLAELVELQATVNRALFDYLARNVSRLRAADRESEQQPHKPASGSSENQ